MKQFTFIYNNRKYITLVGGSNSFDSIKSPGSNAVDFNKIAVNNGLIGQFIYEFGIKITDAPLLEDAEITVEGEVYLVKGTYTDDSGSKVSVEITKDEIIVSGEETESEVEEPEQPQEQVEEEEPEQPQEQVEEEVPEQVQEQVEDEVPEQHSTENTVEEEIKAEQDEVPEQPQEQEEVAEQPIEEVSEQQMIEVSANEHTVDNVSTPVQTENENTHQSLLPNSDKPVIGYQFNVCSRMRAGFYLGSCEEEVVNEEEDVMGNSAAPSKIGFMLPDDKVIGFKMGKANKDMAGIQMGVTDSDQPLVGMYLSNEHVNKTPAPTETKKVETPTTRKPSKEVKLEEPEVPVVKPFIKPAEKDYIKPPVRTQSVPTVSKSVVKSEEPVVSEHATAEERAKVLDSLDPELRDMIERIPVPMLGTIEEFTSNSIDVEDLEKRGHMYCVEKRWKQSGNWFCIDAVNEMKRYFYNRHDHQSVGIAIAIVRECYKVLK